MTKIGIKKTLNLHKYNIRLTDFLGEWKMLITVVASVAGIVCGTVYSKGEGAFFQKITDWLFNSLVLNNADSVLMSFVSSLMLPTGMCVALFFLGLSAYGGLVSFLIPFANSFIVGILTYYLYNEYTLKGLACFVILVLPFAVITQLGIMLITVESVSMSQIMIKSIGGHNKGSLYNFTYYYKNCLKSYLIVVVGAVIKTLLDELFIGLFVF